MQNDFKVGDDVICICKDTIGRKCFEENKKYKVTSVGKKFGLITVQGSDWYWSYTRFEKAKEDSEFDYFKTPWFIRINTETEFNLVVGFLKSKGFVFENFQSYESSVAGLTNHHCLKTIDIDRITKFTLSSLQKQGVPEIKIQFETNIKSVIYPKITSEKDLEIQKIQEEMKKLSDRLEALKEEN